MQLATIVIISATILNITIPECPSIGLKKFCALDAFIFIAALSPVIPISAFLVNKIIPVVVNIPK